jgi:hypothetical protein
MTENVVHYVVDRLCDDLKKYICTLDILRDFYSILGFVLIVHVEWWKTYFSIAQEENIGLLCSGTAQSTLTKCTCIAFSLDFLLKGQ